MNEVNKNKIIGLFGKNIGNSLSPDIHNYLANVMGLKYHYFLFDLSSDDLEKAVESIRVLDIKGVNVTIPYKREVIKYIDEVDDEIKIIGAVNTILNQDGKLIGKNTDVDGFDEMIYNQAVTFKDKNVVLLGAGGAARAVLYYLRDQEVKEVNIVNRTINKAEEVKWTFSNELENIEITERNSSNYEDIIKQADIIINATPLGTKGRYEDISPVAGELIQPDHTLIDLVYNPKITKFLKTGKEKNARIISGIEMLVYQAVKSFEIWTDSMVEYHVIKELINNL